MLQCSTTPLARLRGIGLEVKRFADDHQEFLLLLALFLSLRLSLLIISRPQGYFHDGSDYDFYLELGRLSDQGLYPVLHYWMEYPPVFPWISVLVYRATEIIPNLQGSPILWFRITLGSLLLLFDIGNLVLIYSLSRTLYPHRRALQIAYGYALLFTPLHVWLGWFDTMPLFFLLLALTLAVKGRYSSSALVVGVGFMVKLFPILALPLLLKSETRLLHRAKLLAWSVLAVAAVASPFLIQAPRYLVASFQSMVSRSPWETPWAVMEGYFGYGEVAPLADRWDPTTASIATYPSHLPWVLITGVFALLYLFLWTRRFEPRRGMDAISFTGLTVNLFLLYSKGYSPQFLVYVVPFALLVLPPLRAVAYLAMLSAINLLEYPIYGALFRDLPELLRDLVAIRTLLLLLLSWEYLTALGLVPTAESVRKGMATSALVAFALWGATTLPAAAEEWVNDSITRSPHAPLVDYLLANTNSDSVVVFTEQWLYRELYPYLYQRTNLYLVTRTREGEAAAGTESVPGWTARTDEPGQLAELSSHFREIYGVHHVADREGRRLEQVLAYQNRFQAARQVKDLTVSRWSTGRR